MTVNSNKNAVKFKKTIRMFKKGSKRSSKVSAIMATLSFAFIISVFTLPAYASSGTILIGTSTPPSNPNQSVVYGGNVNLYLGGVTWSGTQFSLYMSRDSLTQISAGDNLYTPLFNVSDLNNNVVVPVTNGTMSWNIGYKWVNGSIPKSPTIVSIPGGANFIKASDGGTTVAKSDTSINITGSFHVHTLNTGPGGGAILLEGHAFTANGTANIEYLNPTTASFVPLVSNVTVNSLGNFLYNTNAPDLMLNNPAGDNPPQSNVITFRALDSSNGIYYNTSSPLTYTEMRRGLSQIGNAVATGLFGNNTNLSSAAVGVSQSLVLTGKWFAPGNTSIAYDRTTVGTVTANGTGFFTTTVSLPSVTAGTHQVSITDADGYIFVVWISVVPS